MTGRMPRGRRVVAATSLLVGLLLAGCTGDDSRAAVGLDDATAAVVTVAATGPVAEPGGAVADTSRVAAGFVVDPDGVVVTTADVAAGAGDLSVRIGADDDPLPATLLGVSECLDLAVLRIDGDDARPFLAWRRGEAGEGTALHAVTPGSDATGSDATGSPADGSTADGSPADGSPAAGVPPTVAGTVTAVEEPFVGAWVAARSGIRHDLALAAGASGAPLLDDDGGIVAIAHVEDDGDTAVAGAIARSDVESIVADAAAFPSLGISARAWTDADGTVSGVWVRSVVADGRAAAAGVQPGDVILRLGEDDLSGDATLSSYCSALAGADGGALALQVYRPSTDQVLVGDTGGAPLAVVSTGEIRRSGAFATVADASGLVRVDVPVEWASVDGAGFTDAAGDSWYSVVAAPSADRFRSSRTAPGVQVAATRGVADVVDLLTVLSAPYEQECTPLDTVQQYDDGVYAGAYSRYSCGGTLAMVVSVRAAGGANVVVVVQAATPADQQQTLTRILSTFAVGAP